MSPNTTSSQHLYVNGLDASTGDYLVPDGCVTPDQIVPVAKAEDGELTAQQIIDLQEKALQTARYAIKPGHDACKPDDAGWGVIWAPDIGQDVKDVLAPLLDLRRSRAGDRYREYPSDSYPEGFQPGMDGLDFMSRNHVLPGAADPQKMPYYLLIVGDPKTIPFAFQHQLDADRGSAGCISRPPRNTPATRRASWLPRHRRRGRPSLRPSSVCRMRTMRARG